ncbi:MAG: type III pantothenate kinase [Halioglobus sp.]
MSICLQLDVGNSSAKWRLLKDGAVLSRGFYNATDTQSQRELQESADQVDEIWVSSVAGGDTEAELTEMLLQRWDVTPWFARTSAATGQLRNSYADPTRMGIDRWLAMLGARERWSKRLCVVDAGSALTIDLVSASGQHEGGYIIPGPALMERALLLDTDRVRFAEDVSYNLAPGVSTAEAVRHGIALAQVGSLVAVLDACQDEMPLLVFCGGGGQTLMNLLGRGGEHAPDLVFEGLELMAALSDRS